MVGLVVRSLTLPILKELVKGGIDYGNSLLVEFDSDSIWYETSLTLTAQALKDGIRTDYHTFQHAPSEIREALARLGLTVKPLEEQNTLRIIDSYTVQTGLGLSETSEESHASHHYLSESLNLSDWSIANVQRIKSGVPEEDKRRLHIDDNTGVLLQYNDEKAFIDNWRTRHRPHTGVQEVVVINALMKGVASDPFTKQFESLSDGILDFKIQEKEGQIEQLFRVRAMRGRSYDSRWHQLQILQNGEVTLDVNEFDKQRAHAARALISGITKIKLSDFRVFGNYIRFEDQTRISLENLKRRILADLTTTNPEHKNWLIWAPPGTGKTSLVEQLVSGLPSRFLFFPNNLLKIDEPSFKSMLSKVMQTNAPALCFIDEIDGKEKESWPYADLLPFLDANEGRSLPIILLIAGSSGESIEGLKETIGKRFKGTDLLRRVPNKFSVPPITLGDIIVLTAFEFRSQGKKEKGLNITSIDKLVFYYIARNIELGTPSKIKDFVAGCLKRVAEGETRIIYDYLFDSGDKERYEFRTKAISESPGIETGSILVED